MFKALDKTNPDVFPLIIRQFAKDFYEHQDYQTLNDWIVLACDGTKMDLPPSEEMREKFGGYLNQTITDESMVRKPQATCSVLMDVVNHVVLDALIKPCSTSEIPILYEHLLRIGRIISLLQNLWIQALGEGKILYVQGSGRRNQKRRYDSAEL